MNDNNQPLIVIAISFIIKQDAISHYSRATIYSNLEFLNPDLCLRHVSLLEKITQSGITFQFWVTLTKALIIFQRRVSGKVLTETIQPWWLGGRALAS